MSESQYGTLSRASLFLRQLKPKSKKFGRIWLALLATLAVVGLLIAEVYYEHRTLETGYRLSSEISRRESLLEENRKLRIEIRVLSSRERLEPIARREYAMSPVKPSQIIYSKVSSHASPQVTEPTERRSDGLDRIRKIED